MSYRCRTCNKELEDYIFVCDNCGTKKDNILVKDDIKVNDKKKNEEKLSKDDYIAMIVTSIIIMFLSAGVIVYGFFNYDSISSLFMYLGGAVLLVLFGRIVFPKSVLLKVLFYTELFLFFGVIAFPIYLIKGLIQKVG